MIVCICMIMFHTAQNTNKYIVIKSRLVHETQGCLVKPVTHKRDIVSVYRNPLVNLRLKGWLSFGMLRSDVRTHNLCMNRSSHRMFYTPYDFQTDEGSLSRTHLTQRKRKDEDLQREGGDKKENIPSNGRQTRSLIL